MALGLLVVSGSGCVVSRLSKGLEDRHVPVDGEVKGGCILVLGGGAVARVAPRTSVELSEAGARVVHAARLFRAHVAPIVICSGGDAVGGASGRPQADDMTELVEFFGVPRPSVILEGASKNTLEHGVHLAPMLRQLRCKRVLLVTSAMQMRLAIGVMRKHWPEGEVVAAPTDFVSSIVVRCTGIKNSRVFCRLPRAFRWAAKPCTSIWGLATIGCGVGRKAVRAGGLTEGVCVR